MSRPPSSPPPLPKTRRPLESSPQESPAREPDLDEETVVLATDLLKVHQAEDVEEVAEADLVELEEPSNALPARSNLVPQDVLDELHARGEIELEQAQPLLLPRRGREEFDQLAGELEGCCLEEMADRLAEAAPFSQLSRPALERLAGEGRRRTVSQGALLFQENEPAAAHYLVLEGAFELFRGPRGGLLRRAGPGDVLGLLGTLAGGRQVATARALQRSVVYELPGPEVAAAYGPGGHIARLRRFCHERLVELFLADRVGETDLLARAGLRDQFQLRSLPAGESLVAPGEVPNALYLVFSGALHIRRRLVGHPEETHRVGAGECCAVLSASTGTPCRFAIAAAEPTVLARLPQQAFGELGRDHPALRLLVARLPEQGRRLDKDLYVVDLSLPALP